MTLLLARRLCGFWGQLIALLLSSWALFEVVQSRTPAPDTLLGLFTLLFLWSCTRDNPGRFNFIMASLFAGAAIGSKFTGLYLLPFLTLAIVWFASGSLRQRLALLGASGVTVVLSYTVTTPWFWSELPGYLDSMRHEYFVQAGGQIGRIQGGWFDYLFSLTPTWELPWVGTSFLANLGWPATLLICVSVFAALLKIKSRKKVFLALFVLLFLASISGPGRLKAYRFLLPVLPVCYVLLGDWLERVALTLENRWRPLFWAIVVVLVVSPSVAAVVKCAPLLHGRTTIEIASDWMNQQIPERSRVLFSPLFIDYLSDNTSAQALFIPHAGRRQYRLPADVSFSLEREPIYTPALLETLQRGDVRYLVTNSFFDDAFLPVEENLKFFPESIRQYAAFQEALLVRSKKVFSVSGWDESRMGPDIAIYELR
jgi:hypothetical protein